METTGAPIHTQSDLEQLWRQLMEPLGFSRRTLYLMFIEPDGNPITQLTQLDDPPIEPSASDRASVTGLLSHFSAEMGGQSLRLAFLLCRPGNGRARRNDRLWAGLLYVACREAGVPCEVVHLATDDTLMALPPDDVDLHGLA